MNHCSNRLIMAYGLFFGLVCILLTYFFKNDFPRLMVSLIETVLLLFIFEMDRAKRRIQLLPVLLLGLIGISDQVFIQHHSLLSIITGLVIAGSFFAAQFFFSRGKMIGEGDVYLGIALGALFGGPRVLAVLLVSYVVGSLIALFLVAIGKLKRTDPLPLGSFLVMGSLCILPFDHPWSLIGL